MNVTTKTVLLAAFLLLVGCGASQVVKPTLFEGGRHHDIIYEGRPLYVVTAKMPKAIGGLKALEPLMNDARAYRPCKQYGRVISQFIITRDGALVEPVVVHPDNVNAECQSRIKQALRGWKFRPGEHDGQAVDFVMSVPATLVQ
jgi:hypothetical protein